ncbi:major facilitator superfamily domain-containing protein [Circinella umbellata]|nr:major facilitator superfamily domain-containing protein [Circinella umbellata]
MRKISNHDYYQDIPRSTVNMNINTITREIDNRDHVEVEQKNKIIASDSLKVQEGMIHNIERDEMDRFREQNHDEDFNDDMEVIEPIVDKGYAWFVDAGATAAFIFTGFPVIWGLLNVGVIFCNLYYERLGARKLSIIGAFLTFAGFTLTGVATSIWHIYLSLSIAASLGAAILYGVSIRIIPQWFIAKRATAFGIPASSGAFAGLVFPLIITKVNDTLGHHCIFYILGFISLTTSAVAVTFLNDYPSEQKKKKIKQYVKSKNFNWDILRQMDVVLWMVNGPFALSGRLIVFIFLPSYGTHIGLSGTQVAAVTSIASGAQFFGRICLGLAADWIGYMNMYIGSMTVATISILVVWILANDFASLIGFSVIFGFFSGVYVLVNPPIAATIAGMDKYPSAINFIMIMNLLVIIIPAIISIAGNDIDNDNNSIIGDSDPFISYKITSGTLHGICVVLTMIIKLRRNSKLYAKI